MSYHAYTTKFDRVVSAAELDAVLGPLSKSGEAAVDDAWRELQMGLLPWKAKLHLAAADASVTIREKLTTEQRADAAVSLLIDQSGSMRGQKMLFAAAAADVVREFLVTLGISCEVLGFTTSRWLGGHSRERWKWRLRPKNPGRLNDLLHIVYQEASDRRASTSNFAFRQMLRPDLPKENIDGEAVEWAAERLRALQNGRKILIVVSDGAPIDDSTLLANGMDYLRDHLHDVVVRLSASGSIELAAMGTGFQPLDAYEISELVEAPSELGSALLGITVRMLLA